MEAREGSCTRRCQQHGGLTVPEPADMSPSKKRDLAGLHAVRFGNSEGARGRPSCVPEFAAVAYGGLMGAGRPTAEETSWEGERCSLVTSWTEQQGQSGKAFSKEICRTW